VSDGSEFFMTFAGSTYVLFVISFAIAASEVLGEKLGLSLAAPVSIDGLSSFTVDGKLSNTVEINKSC
jgi:hypothetical protein